MNKYPYIPSLKKKNKKEKVTCLQCEKPFLSADKKYNRICPVCGKRRHLSQIYRFSEALRGGLA